MPTYELVILLQKLERPALKEALKRSANYIFDFDGTLRKMENLGYRSLPFDVRNKGKKHHSGHFFIFTYDSSPEAVIPLREKFRLDVDVVKVQNWFVASNPIDLHTKKQIPECTLHVDLLPPPLRPAVIALQESGVQKSNKKKKLMKNNNFGDPEYLII